MTLLFASGSFAQEWSRLTDFFANQMNHMSPTHWMVVCVVVVAMGFMFLRSGGARL